MKYEKLSNLTLSKLHRKYDWFLVIKDIYKQVSLVLMFSRFERAKRHYAEELIRENIKSSMKFDKIGGEENLIKHSEYFPYYSCDGDLEDVIIAIKRKDLPGVKYDEL